MTKIITSDPKNIYKKTADTLFKSANQILKFKNFLTLGLPGGRSIIRVLSHLKQRKLNWNKIHIFMVDERIVPTEHEQNNFRLIKKELSETIGSKNLHPLPYNPKNVRNSMEQYYAELMAYGGKYDIVYLSAGEDGHIASLFPQHPALDDDSRDFIYIPNSPKPPPKRMSISRNLLLRTKIGILLFAGKEKQNAFRKYLEPDLTYYNCPAKLIDQLPQSYVISQFNKV